MEIYSIDSVRFGEEALLNPMDMDRAAKTEGFTNYLNSEMQLVDTKIKQADTSIREFATGENISIHNVMIDISRAQSSFQLMLQIRNKALESAQELLRMQV